MSSGPKTDAVAIRVFLIDDHPVVRGGMRRLVGACDDMSCCGEASSAREALRKLRDTHPDVIVTDLSLPDAGGVELIPELRRFRPEAPVLVLSMHDEALYAERAVRAGARGYVSKDEKPGAVLAAIRTVARGELHLSATMTTRLLTQLTRGVDPTAERPMSVLTNRELEVFEFVGRGYATRRIAETLHLSPKTVETHRRNIKRKLDLPDGKAVVRHAMQWVQSNERTRGGAA